MNILERECCKLNLWTNQWKIIMEVYTAIQNIFAKVWTYYFVAVNLHPCNHFYFVEWIDKISTYVNMRDTYYFFNNEESYYNFIPFLWNTMT